MKLGHYRRNLLDRFGFINSHDPSSADTFYRANLPRFGLTDSAGDSGHAAFADAVMTSVKMPLVAGDVVTSISFVTGATAIGTPAHRFCALYSPAGALLRQTADATGAGAANTVLTQALTSPYTITESGIYEVGIAIDCTTPPSALGCVVAPAVVSGESAIVRRSGSSLTDTAPATISSPSAAEFCPLVIIT